jgi:spore maturation protein CgeB
MQLLYLGTTDGTCLDRANALRRLGHEVTHVNLRALLPANVWIDRLIWRVGAAPLAPWIRRALAKRLRGQRFDAAYVDNGDQVSPAVLHLLRTHAPKVVSYTIDDPFGGRDGRRFSALRSALPGYDLVVVPRAQNVEEARALGARRVLRVHMTADEVQHTPRLFSSAELEAWTSEVLFIGTWMPERGPFLAELLRLGVPLSVRGSNWRRAPEWPLLAKAYKGGPVFGDDYARAIQGARVSLGLLSKGNRDLHTTRSLEVPALGGLLCAQRTSEHIAMYDEGREAVFWSDAEECAGLCIGLLADEPRRNAIAEAGRRRVHRNGHFNEPMLRSVIEALTAAPMTGAMAGTQ